MIYAPLVPLQFSDTVGYQKVSNAQQLVKFHLTNLLMTNPGERIPTPDYGVGMRSFLFEPLTDDTLYFIKSRISSQIKTYLGYLIVDDISVVVDPDNENVIKVAISYTVDSIDTEELLVIDLDYSSMSLTRDSTGVNY